jgi:hypothetical protein
MSVDPVHKSFENIKLLRAGSLTKSQSAGIVAGIIAATLVSIMILTVGFGHHAAVGPIGGSAGGNPLPPPPSGVDCQTKIPIVAVHPVHDGENVVVQSAAESSGYPTQFFYLSEVSNASCNGTISYWFKFTYINSTSTEADWFQFHIAAPSTGLILSTPARLDLLNATGSELGHFNSTLSSWSGDGLNCSTFLSQGGWSVGATSGVGAGDWVRLNSTSSLAGLSLEVAMANPVENGASEAFVPI